MIRAGPTYFQLWIMLCAMGCTQDTKLPVRVSTEKEDATSTVTQVASQDVAARTVKVPQVNVTRPTIDESKMEPIEVTAVQTPTKEPNSVEPNSVEPEPDVGAPAAVPDASTHVAAIDHNPVELEEETPAAERPRRKHDFENLTEPRVELSEEHEQTCLVKVGDEFPALTVTTLSGGAEALSEHYGNQLSLIVFWTANRSYGMEQFRQLKSEILEPYGPDGVGLVAVNVGGPIEEVQQHVDEHGGGFANFVDPDRAAFDEIATRKLPRTYLIDSNGSILWFDIEYSRSTRRDLDRAIRFYLSGRP